MKEETDGKIAFLVALNKVQGLLEPVSKDSVNPHFKSKYASLGAVNNSIMGPLTEAGFVLMSGGVDIAGKPYLRTTLSHIKGHSESFDYPIVNDGNPQHIASSITYARRYAICSFFNLSVEDDDGNLATHKPQVSAAVKQTFAPKAAAPVAATNDAASGVHFIPKTVSVKNGTGAKGNWTKYGILDGDTDTWYGTFEDEIGQAAIKAKEDGTEISFSFKNDGKYNNIVALRLEEAVPF